ncbi:SDR family NAD(P)-dependent oxidoreductase, partial [Pseudomonas syringae]
MTTFLNPDALQGKVALISGGATLIGMAVARGLIDAGARVALFDIDAEAGRQAAEQLGK